MGSGKKRKAATQRRNIYTLVRIHQDQDNPNTDIALKTRKAKHTSKRKTNERMSLMTLFAGPTPTHLDRSLHDLMFSPTSLRTRCGGGSSLARQHCGGTRMDVIEHSDKYDLVVDAPGLTPADIHVKLEDGVLSVEGKHEVRETKEDSAGKVVYSERRRSSFSRRFALPDDADESSIHAKRKDGVVTISIGKAAPSAPRVRHIPVSSLADGACASPSASPSPEAGAAAAPAQHDGDTVRHDEDA